jgi:hypothetical protein
LVTIFYLLFELIDVSYKPTAKLPPKKRRVANQKQPDLENDQAVASVMSHS